MWYRIFADRPDVPAPSAILDYLKSASSSVSGEFEADPSGWYQADLVVEGVSVLVERYVADEPGIRAELNSWAAWLETREDLPDNVHLMERMIQTAQLFTLRPAEQSARIDAVCIRVCQFLARTTAGIYQIDGCGLFAAEGTLLVPE